MQKLIDYQLPLVENFSLTQPGSYLKQYCFQINFLNSVIVDLQRKNEELKVKLKKLALAEFNGNDEDNGLVYFLTNAHAGCRNSKLSR